MLNTWGGEDTAFATLFPLTLALTFSISTFSLPIAFAIIAMIHRGIKRAKHGGYKTKLLQKETEARLEVQLTLTCSHLVCHTDRSYILL